MRNLIWRMFLIVASVGCLIAAVLTLSDDRTTATYWLVLACYFRISSLDAQ